MFFSSFDYSIPLLTTSNLTKEGKCRSCGFVLTGFLALFSFTGSLMAQEAGFTHLTGRIIFQGDPLPQRKPFEVNRDKECCLRGGEILTDN
ncbi:MAG: hypothetical protein EXR99_05645 [Gemmataceae bacterium]|nr:hypothetical protein [Gemmataceae bacterium]